RPAGARPSPDDREEVEADPRPLDREMDGRENQPNRPEHRPARAPRRGRHRDEDEPTDGEERPLEVAAVPEEEQAAAHEEAGDEVQPESIWPARPVVQGGADEEVTEADDDRHDRRPVAPVRDDVRDEEPRGDAGREYEQREAVAAELDERGAEDQQLEQEQARMEAGERGVRARRQPTPPSLERTDEEAAGGDRAEGEEAGGEPVITLPERDGDRGEDGEHERRPARPR